MGSQSRKTDAPIEDEGLGAVYDTREWMKNYYGEHYEDDSFWDDEEIVSPFGRG